MVIGFNGCKKRSEQAKPEDTTKSELSQPVKPKDEEPIEDVVVKKIDYAAEAEKEISSKNMASELEKLEKEVESDILSGDL
jgi:hypothetical protein